MVPQAAQKKEEKKTYFFFIYIVLPPVTDKIDTQAVCSTTLNVE